MSKEAQASASSAIVWRLDGVATRTGGDFKPEKELRLRLTCFKGDRKPSTAIQLSISAMRTELPGPRHLSRSTIFLRFFKIRMKKGGSPNCSTKVEIASWFFYSEALIPMGGLKCKALISTLSLFPVVEAGLLCE